MKDDYSKYIIPAGLDYVIEILFWNVSEIAIASIFIVYGIVTHQLVVGLFGFFGLLMILKKYKSRVIRGMTQHVCWHYSLMREKGLKSMPSPAITRFEQ